MKFLGKTCFQMILKVSKTQGFTFSLKDIFFKKPQGAGKGGGGQLDPLSPSPPGKLGLSFNSAVAAMISFSILLRGYSAKYSLSPLTQSSLLASPLPPSLLGRYNHSTFDLGDNLSCFLFHFLHILFRPFNNANIISNI